MRCHAVRSCTYFAVASIEALLNQQMRRHLEGEGVPESEIFKRLRRTTLNRKREEWPTEICGKSVSFGVEVSEIFETYKTLRDEITHPKRRDHSIYVELEQADPLQLADAVSRAIVRLREGQGAPFPYWVLGWNYVGLNADPAHPFQSNNMNGFVWSLRNMGYNVNVGDVNWDKHNMVSIAHYEALKSALGKYHSDIEPYNPIFPQKPRLTRRWWDREFIYADLHASRVKAGDSR